jgi:hypothetical protein
MRMTNVRGAGVLGLVSLALAACGDVTPRAPEATELAKAICPKVWGECCKADQLKNNEQAGTDEASCEKKTDDALQQYVVTIKASEKKGRATYDSAKVEACAAFIRGATCDELNVTNHVAGLPACSSYATPKVAAGGACGNDFECIDGFCDKSAAAQGADGACKTRSKSGEACGDVAMCEATLACDGATMTCATPPKPANACFYSSGCNVAGGRGGPIAIALLALAAWRRRRATRR